MTLYVEDDNLVNPYIPITSTRQLLRFRHNVEEKIVVHPRWSFDKNVTHLIKTENYENTKINTVDFYGQVFVPLVNKKVYTGTTATLFKPNGDLLVKVTAHLHPEDQFCRLTGRQVSQRKLINALSWRCVEDGSCIQIDNMQRTLLITKLIANKTAQPLNW